MAVRRKKEAEAGSEESRELVYVDDPDRVFQQWLQNPETQMGFLRGLLQIHEDNWPDMIMLSDLLQVPEDQVDALPVRAVWRVEGRERNLRDVSFGMKAGEVIFVRPKQTRFVFMEMGNGTYAVARWTLEKFGPYEDIPAIGMTPSEFIQVYVEGAGTEGLKQKFENARKRRGGASVTRWRSGHLPSPRIAGSKAGVNK